MQEIIERYQRHTKDVQTENPIEEQNMQVFIDSLFLKLLYFPSFNSKIPQEINKELYIFIYVCLYYMQHLKHESTQMMKKIDLLETSKR